MLPVVWAPPRSRQDRVAGRRGHRTVIGIARDSGGSPEDERRRTFEEPFGIRGPHPPKTKNKKSQLNPKTKIKKTQSIIKTKIRKPQPIIKAKISRLEPGPRGLEK
ncbi:hypothetical protein V3C99_018133 [Haemonchus contortus]|uniref:Uncharacterized protein n=1 Tax=Haemonchus contortus TaxID=6289 RepID=A0A7I4Z261_HAECO